eukprot:TRINITY_DN4248_c0_g1_i1.p1 TRINITY_DN4248_c0_g1~~TRINITY_DN4248_c0_g1_i1.p1  ORF type:complete len:857 (-),score=300.02 TRINITY_DN4248_c0_g1_i1:66-2636(-)
MDKKRKNATKESKKSNPKKIKPTSNNTTPTSTTPQFIFNNDCFSTPSYVETTTNDFDFTQMNNTTPIMSTKTKSMAKTTIKATPKQKKGIRGTKSTTKKKSSMKGQTQVCAHPEHDYLFPNLPREQSASEFYPTSKTKCKRCYIHDQMERQKTRKVKTVEKLIPASTLIMGRNKRGMISGGGDSTGGINIPVLPPSLNSSINNGNSDMIEVDVVVNNSLYGEPYVIHTIEEKRVEVMKGDPIKVKQFCLPLLDKLISHPHSWPFTVANESGKSLNLTVIRERLNSAGTTLRITRPRGRPPSTPQPNIPSFDSFQAIPRNLSLEGFPKMSLDKVPPKKTPAKSKAKPKAKPKKKPEPKKTVSSNETSSNPNAPSQNITFEEMYSLVSSEAIYPGLTSTDENPFPTIQSTLSDKSDLPKKKDMKKKDVESVDDKNEENEEEANEEEEEENVIEMNENDNVKENVIENVEDLFPNSREVTFIPNELLYQDWEKNNFTSDIMPVSSNESLMNYKIGGGDKMDTSVEKTDNETDSPIGSENNISFKSNEIIDNSDTSFDFNKNNESHNSSAQNNKENNNQIIENNNNNNNMIIENNSENNSGINVIRDFIDPNSLDIDFTAPLLVDPSPHNYKLQVGGKTLTATSNVGHYLFMSQLSKDVKSVFKGFKNNIQTNPEVHKYSVELEELFDKWFEKTEDLYNSSTKKMEKCCVCKSGGEVLICSGPCIRSFHLNCVHLNHPPKVDWKCSDCKNHTKILYWDSNQADYYYHRLIDPKEEELNNTIITGSKTNLRYDPIWCCWREMEDVKPNQKKTLLPFTRLLTNDAINFGQQILQTKLMSQHTFFTDRLSDLDKMHPSSNNYN